MDLGQKLQEAMMGAGVALTLTFGVPTSAEARGARHTLDEGQSVARLYWRLIETSDQKLSLIHPDLQKVIQRAQQISEEIYGVPFIITEGCRSPEDQKNAVARGASWTLRSKHLIGHAADVMPEVVKKVGQVFNKEGNDVNEAVPAFIDPHSNQNYGSEFAKIREAMIQAAEELKISIAFVRNDSPHVELDSKSHPPPKFKDRAFCR